MSRYDYSVFYKAPFLWAAKNYERNKSKNEEKS